MTDNRLARVRDAVAAMYERNRQRGRAEWCGYDYDFVCPSTGTYPFQWFWDSCFHAIALSHIDPERGASEIRSLLANQHEDGLVSHVTFWQRERYEEMLATYAIAYRTPHLSDCMQPPLLAEAVAAVSSRGAGDAFLREVLPAVRRFYDWLDRVRDPDGDGLVAIIQADESGLDHSPKFDALLRLAAPEHDEATAAWKRVYDKTMAVGRAAEKVFEIDNFVVEEVLVNTIYAENQRVLAELLDRTGDVAGAAEMRRRAARTTRALVEKCFDAEAGLFFDLAGRTEEKQRVSTISSLMPILLPDLPATAASALVAHIEDAGDYAARYPVPSVSMREPSFAPGTCGGVLVWRGPTWINTNWYIARGLRRHNRPDLAERIEDASVELTEQFGFREYYNPHTGEGHGAHDFSWSGIVVDMLASRT